MTSPSVVHFEVEDPFQEPIPAKLIFLGLDANHEIVFQYFPNFNQMDFSPEDERYWCGSLNTIQTPIGMASVELDSGSYLVVATRGLEYSIAGDTLHLPEMEDTTMVFVLEHMLEVPGRISIDFHVHSAASVDSRLNSRIWEQTFASSANRIIDFLTVGLHMVVSADHNQSLDYSRYIQSFSESIGELEGFSPEYITEKFASITGNELGLYVQEEWEPPDCPPLESPRQVAHFNVWPLDEGPSPQPCDDVYRQPATLYDIARNLDPDPQDYREIIQLNHPRGARYDWSYPLPGIYGSPTAGYFHNWNYDPNQPIPPTNDGGPNSFLRI
jgi:hypothetical protein